MTNYAVKCIEDAIRRLEAEVGYLDNQIAHHNTSLVEQRERRNKCEEMIAGLRSGIATLEASE